MKHRVSVSRLMLLLGVVAGLGWSSPILAQSLGEPDQLIVTLKPDAAGQRAAVSAESRVQAALDRVAAAQHAGLRRMRQMATGSHVIKVSGTAVDRAALNRLAAALSREADVASVEVDEIMQPLAVPNDTSYGSQWNLFEATGGIDMPAAWEASAGTGVRVAVLDTGYRPHADLAANIVGGYDMVSDPLRARDSDGRDPNAQDPGDWTVASDCLLVQNSSWHGTRTAGIISAITGNALGIAGVAFGSQIVPVRVLGECGGTTSDISDGIMWAAGGSVPGLPVNPNPVRVINMSLGGVAACGSAYQTAIDFARSHGIVVVVAAGNSAVDASNFTPANCNGVIAVAATTRAGGRTSYSNFGAIVKIAAPGGDSLTANEILSTANTGTTTPVADSYGYDAGTSFSAPQVAAVAALLLSQNPTWTPDQVLSRLQSTARAFPASCPGCGSGIVDAAAALGGTPPGTGSAGSLSFQYSGNSINEPATGSTQLTVTVLRSGGSTGAAYVRYSTADGTAIAGSPYADYDAASGVLRWANGDTSAKSFAITINNDSRCIDTSFHVNLSDPVGGSLGSTTSQAIEINDYDHYSGEC